MFSSVTFYIQPEISTTLYDSRLKSYSSNSGFYVFYGIDFDPWHMFY